MGLFIPKVRVKHKKFDYQPRFYDPEKEKKIKERMRIRSRARRRRSPMGIIYAFALLAVVYYVYQNLL